MDQHKLSPPDTEYAKMDILENCEELLSELEFDRDYLEYHFIKYDGLRNYLDSIDKAIIKAFSTPS